MRWKQANIDAALVICEMPTPGVRVEPLHDGEHHPLALVEGRRPPTLLHRLAE